MIWNIFSSKESTFAFWELSNLLLSKTHFLQLHAGHTFLQALQRIHLLSSLWKKANFSSGLIASILLTPSNDLHLGVLGLADDLVIDLMFFAFTYMTSFQHTVFVSTCLLTVDSLDRQCLGIVCDLSTLDGLNTFDSLFFDLFDIQFSFTSHTNDVALSLLTLCSLISWLKL